MDAIAPKNNNSSSSSSSNSNSNSNKNVGNNALKVVKLTADFKNTVDHHVDDVSALYVSPTSLQKKGTSTSNPIYVESDSDDEDLRLAIMESPVSAQHSSGGTSVRRRSDKRAIDLSGDDDDDDEDDDDLKVIYRSPPKKIVKGESSNPKRKNDEGMNIGGSVEHSFMCDICVDEKPNTSLFHISGCDHYYCSDCVAKYVASELEENMSNISCPVPDCGGSLEPEHCRSILPPEVFVRWGDVLCESLFLASERFYCPFKDCSELLIVERRYTKEVIKKFKCPNCTRLFCVKCRAPWHPDISCADFDKLNKDERQKEDIMLFNLAKENNWRRCPRCKFYVEKSDGCIFMRCRCKYTFCYNCGAAMKTYLGHFCKNCHSS